MQPRYYENENPAAVSVRLRSGVSAVFSPTLETILNSEPWLYQNQPLPMELVEALLNKIKVKPALFQCPFTGICQDETDHRTKAVDHILEHLGYRPYACEVW